MKDLLNKLFLASLAAFSPIKMVMITVGILIIADLITGVWAAIKRGETISSSAMRRTVSKMCIYELTVICGFMLETYILGQAIPVAKIVASVIGVVEFKSILENANSIVKGDIFKIILKKLGSDNDNLKKG